jgi:hypothetical protein
MKVAHLIFKVLEELKKGEYTKAELELVENFSRELNSITKGMLKKIEAKEKESVNRS